MSLFGDPNMILQLQKLLQPPDDDNLEDSDKETDEISGSTSRIHNFGPSDMSKMINHKGGENSDSNTKHIDKSDLTNMKNKVAIEPTTMEEWETMEAELNDNLVLDTRKRPEFNVSYEQSVKTQDLFLQMDNKTSATSSCEKIIIKIMLPEETATIERMELSVAHNKIDLKTPVYRLHLPLPQNVDPDKGNAVWDNDSKVFIISLVMNREFDYVNF